ncbi:MAG TPA: EAL domain-containing protein, partial [Gammaproteobacteria bacterium]|nr:EAL domain-containing protein [Gammaproteobacteria bacterium]
RQKVSQEKLFDQQEKARITLTSIGDAVISTDIHGRIEFINNAAEQLLGYTLNEVYGKAFSQTFVLVDENDPESVKKPVEFCLTHPETSNISETAMLLHHNGTPISINTNAASIHNSNNQLTGVVLVLRDISKERKLVRKIAHQATHDELTGLTNRRGFEVQLQYAIDNRRSSSAKYSFCYIDLDEFKVVNDTCGHTAGDELLKLISAKIKKHIRKDDVLARLGGDEFGILLTNCEIDVAEKIAHSIRKEVKNTQFVWDSKLFTVGASIGLFFIDKQTESITDVLSAADSACYIAKERGRDAVHIYTPDDKAIAEHIGLMQWPTRIRSALKKQNFVLYKQLIAPTNPAKNKAVTEFLIRLKSDDGDLIPPMAFIPAAERYNLMHEIDCWVIKHAIEEIESLGNSNMLYSINLSGQSLGKSQLYKYIASNITQTGVNPNQLCFEITETAAITNQESALTLITQLKKLGCLFALDDFGTGLSSFSYLKTLPVDILKIDGVFIRNMVTDRIDQSLVKTINHIGHELNLKTIAEWVETEESKSLLTDIGVDYLQGYYIEEPVIASIFSSDTD